MIVFAKLIIEEIYGVPGYAFVCVKNVSVRFSIYTLLKQFSSYYYTKVVLLLGKILFAAHFSHLKGVLKWKLDMKLMWNIKCKNKTWSGVKAF